jgi:hypothetical protein
VASLVQRVDRRSRPRYKRATLQAAINSVVVLVRRRVGKALLVRCRVGKALENHRLFAGMSCCWGPSKMACHVGRGTRHTNHSIPSTALNSTSHTAIQVEEGRVANLCSAGHLHDRVDMRRLDRCPDCSKWSICCGLTIRRSAGTVTLHTNPLPKQRYDH